MEQVEKVNQSPETAFLDETATLNPGTQSFSCQHCSEFPQTAPADTSVSNHVSRLYQIY